MLDTDIVELELIDYSLGADGVLQPFDDRQPRKAVDRGVAALLAAAASGPVTVESSSGWVRSDIAAVVLDGVARLHSKDRTVRGVSAVSDLFPSFASVSDEAGPLQRLSDHALQTAADYCGERRLADLLYAYGRLPVGDAELATLPDRAATSRWLGIDPAPEWLRPWARHDLRDAGWWNLWHLRDATQSIDRDEAVTKLYVSPQPADLPDALHELARTAAEVGIPAIKVGSDAHAVYRPDKLVAYAVDRGQLDALATRLLPRLSGMVAHGVPFTAERSSDGLLSWGADPSLVETDGIRESWRQRITAVAAEGLRRAAGHDRTMAVAMARAWLWVNDIDPSTWAPVAA